MKSIARHAKEAFALGAVTAICIGATWSQALAVPGPVDVPEPSSMALMAVGVGAVAVYHKLRKRK